jgi:predicted RNA binding protein YcfA (HicA-like mRNA interferase family)
LWRNHAQHADSQAEGSSGELVKLGFEEVRQRRSHKQFRNPDGRSTTLPFYSSRDISPISLRQIAKDINLTIEELIRNR